ncbi:hypothetical protein DPMN_082702 [Dreissena polymorpha]|uniref:Uncharacterized protein n=1 Tax=Dreissena polymorpha TaxID=45954 RepID=A0A9D4BH18_DREPO|nr:hypothetical protein DPMN_082702 [Dreissena polymorpha]
MLKLAQTNRPTNQQTNRQGKNNIHKNVEGWGGGYNRGYNVGLRGGRGVLCGRGYNMMFKKNGGGRGVLFGWNPLWYSDMLDEAMWVATKSTLKKCVSAYTYFGSPVVGLYKGNDINNRE